MSIVTVCDIENQLGGGGGAAASPSGGLIDVGASMRSSTTALLVRPCSGRGRV